MPTNRPHHDDLSAEQYFAVAAKVVPSMETSSEARDLADDLVKMADEAAARMTDPNHRGPNRAGEVWLVELSPGRWHLRIKVMHLLTPIDAQCLAAHLYTIAELLQ
jgi:hypothetical protein